MNIRKISAYGAVLAFFAVLCVWSSGPAWGTELDLKLFGGYNYLWGGDLNTGTEGFTNFWLDLVRAAGWSVGGTYKPAHFGFSFGGDLIFLLSPTLGIAFGAEYLQASPETNFSLTHASDSGNIIVEPNASAVPLKVSLYVSIPSGTGFRTTLHVGAGYYLAKMSSRVRLEEGGDFIQWENTASANGFGFHGGLGFEFELSPAAALFLEARGRYAKFGGFDGDMVLSDTSGSVTESGKLYYWEEQGITAQFYPVLMVADTEPTPTSYRRNIREGKVDFSGAGVVGGLVIRF